MTVMAGENDEKIMANVDGTESHKNDDELILPHLTYSESQLPIRYPPLEAPAAVDGEDPNDIEEDRMMRAGEITIRQITEAYQAKGRRRRLE